MPPYLDAAEAAHPTGRLSRRPVRDYNHVKMNPIRYLCDARRWLVDPYGLLDDALARRGLTFRIRLPVLGEVLMTGDPRLTAEIARHKDLDGGIGVAALGALLGRRSLIVLKGEAHAARHRLIAPLFRGESLQDYDELTVRRTREAFERLPTGRTFSLYDVLRGVGLRILVAAMFGDDGAVAAEAEEKVERFLHSFRNPLVLFCPPLRLDAGPWSPWGRAAQPPRVVRFHPAGDSRLPKIARAAGRSCNASSPPAIPRRWRKKT